MLNVKYFHLREMFTPIVFKYQLNGILLENISCYNDLGVTVDKSLVFNNHGCNVMNRCKKVNGMIMV